MYAQTALPPNAWAYTLTMPHQKMRKTLSLLVAVVLLVVGLWGANVFSNPIQGKETISAGTLTLEAEGQDCAVYQERVSSDYYVQVDAEFGSVEVYVNDENGTVSYWDKDTPDPMTPNYNGSSGEFVYSIWAGYDLGYQDSLTRYLVFHNPDSDSKAVSYEVSRYVTYNNYIALTACIALATAGAILLGLTLLGNKLHDFNRALDNQV